MSLYTWDRLKGFHKLCTKEQQAGAAGRQSLTRSSMREGWTLRHLCTQTWREPKALLPDRFQNHGWDNRPDVGPTMPTALKLEHTAQS